MTVFVDELKVWPHARHRCFGRRRIALRKGDLAELELFAGFLARRHERPDEPLALAYAEHYAVAEGR